MYNDNIFKWLNEKQIQYRIYVITHTQGTHAALNFTLKIKIMLTFIV